MYVKGKVIESCLRLFGAEVSPHLLGKTSSKFEKVVNLRDLNYPTVSCQLVLKISSQPLMKSNADRQTDCYNSPAHAC